jgi:uncharacterized membrane protein YccC
MKVLKRITYTVIYIVYFAGIVLLVPVALFMWWCFSVNILQRTLSRNFDDRLTRLLKL